MKLKALCWEFDFGLEERGRKDLWRDKSLIGRVKKTRKKF